jgi:hypothetical protein
MSTGNGNTCAITVTQTIDCLYYGGSGAVSLNPPPAGTFTSVAVGGDFACALGTDQAITCWGNDSDGQADAPAGHFKAVTAGNLFACGLSTAGTVSCWGDNSLGQLTGIPAGTFTVIAAGWSHACGIRTDGYLQCWGENNHGQLGAAPYVNPQPAPDGLDGFIYFYDLGVPNVVSTSDLDGSPPGTFTVSKGAIPPGLSLDPLYGLLQGMPSTPGSFRFTASISNLEGAESVSEHIIVAGYLLGFRSPAPGARLSTLDFTARFQFGGYHGPLIAARYARGLRLRLTISAHRNGKSPLASATCMYRKSGRAYACTLHVARRLATGRHHPYFLTVYQFYNGSYQSIQAGGRARADQDPEEIYFR